MKILVMGAGKMGSFFIDVLSFDHEVAVFERDAKRMRFTYNCQRFTTFEEIKAFSSTSGGSSVKKCDFVLATVKGDVHDIGKNIVKLLLENYGFNVIDLGKDVPAEDVVEAAVKAHAPLVGLSALMTTTVPAMEETIKLLRERAPWCKIIVGGAVLTVEYAERIGADKYAADAMETVRYAETIANG
jgi:5-methyltetrahydrofolate--homocysteine methyltransferase